MALRLRHGGFGKPASSTFVGLAAALLTACGDPRPPASTPAEVSASLPAYEDPVVQEWLEFHSQCRDGNGEEAFEACRRREGLNPELAARGWCYERGHGGGFDWQRCSGPPTAEEKEAKARLAVQAIPGPVMVTEKGVTFDPERELTAEFLGLSIGCGASQVSLKTFLQMRIEQARQHRIRISYDVGDIRIGPDQAFLVTEHSAMASGERIVGYPESIIHLYVAIPGGVRLVQSEPQTETLDPVTFMRLHSDAVCSNDAVERAHRAVPRPRGNVPNQGRSGTIVYNPFRTDEPSSSEVTEAGAEASEPDPTGQPDEAAPHNVTGPDHQSGEGNVPAE